MEFMERDELLKKIGSIKKWYHRVELMPGVVTPGISPAQEIYMRLGLPEDMSGLRVLDIGTNDGFYAFECERRNAREVIAIDHFSIEMTGFQVLKDFYESRVMYIQDNVYNITEEKYGTFDVVLFLGVLYHLRNPLRALEIIRSVCRDKLYLESFIIDEMIEQSPSVYNSSLVSFPLMQFFSRDELNSDYTNWWGPTLVCLTEMLESTNFTVEQKKRSGNRTIVECKINENREIMLQNKLEKNLYQ